MAEDMARATALPIIREDPVPAVIVGVPTPEEAPVRVHPPTEDLGLATVAATALLRRDMEALQEVADMEALALHHMEATKAIIHTEAAKSPHMAANMAKAPAASPRLPPTLVEPTVVTAHPPTAAIAMVGMAAKAPSQHLVATAPPVHPPKPHELNYFK